MPIRVAGLVVPRDGHVVIVTGEGVESRLVLEGDAEHLAWLDGHTVRLEGVRVGARVRVGDWRVESGLNGFPAWAGVLTRTRDGLGIHDVHSDVVFALDEDVTEQLAGWVGRWVLVEGYNEGVLGIRVVAFRPLFDEE